MKSVTKNLVNGLCAISACFVMGKLEAQTLTAKDFALDPPLVSSSDPFVMISLSVESPQQAEAYTGAQGTFPGTSHTCPGRTGNLNDSNQGIDLCYRADVEYIGYFDPDKCYVYVKADGSIFSDPADRNYRAASNAQTVSDVSTATRSGDFFRPVASANQRACAGNQFSGNYMNWSTMTALDVFRYAMMGGARIVDRAQTNAQTMLVRTHRYNGPRRWPFVSKIIRPVADQPTNYAGLGFGADPSSVSPFSVTELVADNDDGTNTDVVGNRVSFFNGSTALGRFNVVVEVCDSDVGLEPNCVEYSDGTNSWYKPEGVMQENAYGMRFALATYSSEGGRARNGGVLRSNAKYLRDVRPGLDGELEINPEAEINEFGQFVFNPDNVTLAAGVRNSGILNYISSFGLGANRYKSIDPISELFYESLRYIMNLDPTPEYSSGLTNDSKDNFPVILDWDDPQLNACQDNFILGIGDQFGHADGDLPGTAVPSGDGASSGPPSNAASVPFSVQTITDAIGNYEGMGPNLGSTDISGRENTYYVAGMANWARKNDLRPSPPGGPIPGLSAEEAQSLRDRTAGEQFVKTFYVDTQEYKRPDENPPQGNRNPLWLAAKYGGFDDIDGDGFPTTPNATAPLPVGTPNPDATPCVKSQEWDADGDCIPDAYTLASQPANLVAGLRNAFNDIAAGSRAGSSAGVVSSTAGGQGLIVQGLFSTRKSVGNDVVAWGGLLHSLFVDEFDNIREDTNGDGALTNDDAVIRFQVDQERLITTVNRFTTPDGGQTVVGDADGNPIEADVPLDQLNTIWDARDNLAQLQNVTSQRTYSSRISPASAGRRIYTGIDANADGIVLGNEVVDFDQTNFPAISSDTQNRFRYLGLRSSDDDDLPTNIVNFIRGEEGIADFRNRTIRFNENEIRRPWRLGDIVNSSPVVVGAPRGDQRYDLIYNDDSNELFFNRYENRRQVVYTGANDGMLHAFNAGFFDQDARQFRTHSGDDTTPGGEVQHPLGAELWAYVPFNALPHLRWLTQQDYPHVFYVDGIPQVFDVNTFTPSATHPGGWGTILVVGMRFGGGEISIDPNSDDDTGETTEDNVAMRSAYMIFDVTDPEQEPQLIAEVSHPLMGYTTGRPTVVKSRPREADGTYNDAGDKWFLIMGSGPIGDDQTSRQQALNTAVSNQSAKIFAFDLSSRNFVNFGTEQYLEVPNSANAFVGDFVAADWIDETDGGYADDVVYFGTVSGSVDNPSGDLMRLRLGDGNGFVTGMSASNITRVLERTTGNSIGQPFSGTPFVKKVGNQYWVYTGTGRFFTSSDQFNSVQNSYYGIREPLTNTGDLAYTPVRLNVDLVDVTNVGVIFNEGEIDAGLFPRDNPAADGVVVGPNNDAIENFSELRNLVTNQEQGWFLNFDPIVRAGAVSPYQALHAGRSDGSGSSVAFTEYQPSGDACSIGETQLNVVHFETGTAAPFAAIRDPRDNTLQIRPDGTFASERSKKFADGLVRDVEFVDGRIIGQGTAGDLTDPIRIRDYTPPSKRVFWREIYINW